MQKIKPNLWFDKEAEEAAKFYTSIFKDSKITYTSYYGEEGKEVHGQAAGTVLTVEFELNGQSFTALNGGPLFKFNEAISLMIECDDQAEIDYFWDKLSAVPEAEQCGWLKDKFGVSWQVMPANQNELMSGPNSEKVMAALLKMKKLDVAALEAAARG